MALRQRKQTVDMGPATGERIRARARLSGQGACAGVVLPVLTHARAPTRVPPVHPLAHPPRLPTPIHSGTRRHTRTFPSGPTPSTPPRHVSTLKTRLRALVASVYRSGQAFAPFATRFVAAVKDARPPGRYNCSFAKRCVRAG